MTYVSCTLSGRDDDLKRNAERAMERRNGQSVMPLVWKRDEATRHYLMIDTENGARMVFNLRPNQRRTVEVVTFTRGDR